jgi:hypothetical protein
MTVPQQRHQAEMSAAVAVLSATYQCADGSLTKNDFSAVVASLAVDLFPDEPFNMVLPLSWLALRCAQLYAEATGRPITDVLAELGAEAAGNP